MLCIRRITVMALRLAARSTHIVTPIRLPARCGIRRCRLSVARRPAPTAIDKGSAVASSAPSGTPVKPTDYIASPYGSGRLSLEEEGVL